MGSALSGCTSAGCRSAGKSPRPSPSTTRSASPPSSSSIPPANTRRRPGRALARTGATGPSRTGIEPLHAALMTRWFTDEAAEGQIPGLPLHGGCDSPVLGHESFAAAAAKRCADLNTTPRLPRIAAPTLVIGTPEDPGAPREVTEKMARLIPNASNSSGSPPPATSRAWSTPSVSTPWLRAFLSKQV